LNREKEKEEKLMRSNRELTEFASIVSHDLRAPLRNINSFTQILLKRNQNKFDEKDFEYAQFIQSGVRQSTQLIEDLLNYSRMDKNIGEAQILDLNELVLEVINNNSHYLGEKKASVEISHLPQVKGHSSLLTLIWQNLILNGLKYNDSDIPCITVGYDVIDGQTTFWVRDNGIGIDAQFQEEVFRMFRRLHTINKYEGTGIGLAFCKRVVEYYDGVIYFESVFGKGTTFFFTLPNTTIITEIIPLLNLPTKDLKVAVA
jgi:light-regulated signal transduction histidine kinase (bacteriophytochrome)